MKTRALFLKVVCGSIGALLNLAPSLYAQPAGAAKPSPGAADGAALSQEELDQLLAPIALYPDSLLSQILMAATYPIEVVQAERWAKENSKRSGDALTKDLEQRTWDASVKSLVNFPQVLSMMSEQLDWTSKLGDAFLAQQDQVMASVQKLRAKAKAQGNLNTTTEQKVVVEQQAQTQVIVIEPAQPQVIYVPTYNPTVVYGSWWYPAYPPYVYHPPGYTAGVAAVSFGLGVACGAAWGYAWGNCNWGRGDIDIDVNRNTFVNNSIDRSRYAAQYNRTNNIQGGRGTWGHDPAHRRGAEYRDQRVASQYNGRSTADAQRGRDAYRGRTDAGRGDFGNRPSTQPDRPGGRGERSGTPATADRGGAADRGRDRPTTQDRGANAGSGRDSGGNRGGAFDGGERGSSARASSQRGQASRGGSQRSMSGGSRGGGGGRRR